MNICGLHMFVEHVVQNKVEAAYARSDLFERPRRLRDAYMDASPMARVDSVWVGTGCTSIFGLFCAERLLLAPMESADPRLILGKGFVAPSSVQA